MLRKEIESAGEQSSSASDLLNTRTRYTRRPRRLRPPDAVFQKAKLDFDRATHLYDSQSLTKPDFDSARAQYDATQEQLKSARALTSEAEIALRDTSLVAPFDGEIIKKAVEMGAFVGPGVPLFALAKTDTVKIIVGVPDTIVRFGKGGPAR